MDIFKKIENLLEGELLYKNPDLTLSILAARLGTSSVNISQAIRSNSRQKNFHKYINHFRLTYFVRLLQNRDNHIYTLHTLAQMAGFNSKTTFNKYCVEVTGLSPAIVRMEVSRGKSAEELIPAAAVA